MDTYTFSLFVIVAMGWLGFGATCLALALVRPIGTNLAEHAKRSRLKRRAGYWTTPEHTDTD